MSGTMIRRLSVICTLGLAACAVPIGEDLTGAEAIDETSAEESLLADPRRCERMDLAMSPLSASTPEKSMPLAGPYTARIVNSGNQISCSPPSGDVATTFVWTEEFSTPFAHQFQVQGGSVLVIPSIPAQATALRVYPNPISILNCIAPVIKMRAPGFADRRVTAFTTARVLNRSKFTIECTAHVRGPLSIFRDRPTGVVSTSGANFVYACDLAAGPRRSACSSGLCSVRCTSNLVQPISPEGVNRCISECADRCANVTCPDLFCSGADCSGGGCAPENRCSRTADCGSGRTCSSGCCLTIIR